MTITATTSTRRQQLRAGETLRPLLTHATDRPWRSPAQRPAEAGPPPHRHPREEIYVVLSGQLEVTARLSADPRTRRRRPRAGRYRAQLPQRHRRPLPDITTQGDAAEFFSEAASEAG